MFPLGHLAVGYLSYSVATHLTTGRGPADAPTLAVLFGTQFPDLVDKPLSWWFDVLPGDRTLGHSVYVALLVLIIVGVVASRYDRGTLAMAFGFGYVSHLVMDAFYSIDLFATGSASSLRFLAWPLTSPVVYVVDWELLPYLEATTLSSTFGWELLFSLVVFVTWIRDGAPGVRAIMRRPRG